MSPGTAEIMNRGMNCLLEHLGVVEAERFSCMMRICSIFGWTNIHTDI